MTPICESVRPLCAARVWEDLSPQFFATFWSLTVYDLSVPNAAYEREVQRLKVAIQQTNENRDLPASKRKKELDRCTALMDKLLEEEKKQKDHNERIMARLTQEKDSWFLCQSRPETGKGSPRFFNTAFFLAAFSPRQMPYFALALYRYVRVSSSS
jgi:THO complex subunit 2